MNNTKLRAHLEVVTNVSVVIAVVAVLAAFTHDFFNQRNSPQVTPGLHKGQNLERLRTPIINNEESVLLVALNVNCRYCEEGVPFYNRLFETQQASKSQIALFAVFPNSEEDVRAYADQKHLKIPFMSDMDFRKLSVTGTPTVILIDRAGKVQNFWVGKLSPYDEDEIMKSIQTKT